MARSFGLVDYKVMEAEYFLLQLRVSEVGLDMYGVQFNASAFAAAARSITFAMQASLKGVGSFDEWYAKKQAQLRSNELARFFHELRTVTQHIGGVIVGAGEMIAGSARFFFVPSPDLAKVPTMDVIETCEIHYVQLLELVFECYQEFSTLVDGQWYFTKANFDANGKAIDDAEEELGFPRGWTRLGTDAALEESERWRLLRRQADVCLVSPQFEQWLGKVLPHPDDGGAS